MPERPALPATQTTNEPGACPAACLASDRSWRELTAPLAADDRAAVSALRHLAHSALTAWGVTAEQAEDVVVVLSELVTNALRHTDGPTRVRLRGHADQLILDVADTSLSLPDFETGPDDDEDQPHGFGLALIASYLAETLMVTQHPECGKTVTATFTIKAAAER
ncbi:ATP-binding protein [Actinospica robiniae]|uniref:ATP-binding protein n=1 Tax=Actinospica robiniae TaxID=304901 RepID=UPI000403A8C1|nr:ATP-binding protein [Actinospica robiniae]